MASWISVERLADVLRSHAFIVNITTPEVLANGKPVKRTHEIAARVAAKMQCKREFTSFVTIERDGTSRCCEIRGGQVSSKCYRYYVHKFRIALTEFL